MARVLFNSLLKAVLVGISLALMVHIVSRPFSRTRNPKSVLKVIKENNMNKIQNDQHKNEANKMLENKNAEIKNVETGAGNSWSEAKFNSLSYLYTIDGLNCEGVFNNDTVAMETALAKSQEPDIMGMTIRDFTYIEKAKDCKKFIEQRGYITSTLSKKEEDFPLAYSIMAYKDAEALERLIRAIYRPQNIYCVHIDKKAKPSMYAAIEAVSKCFSNVFMASRRIDVVWNKFTVLEPELLCMEELYKRQKNWKYFINLTGQEFPLQSNRELVEILTAYKGAVDVEGVLRNANKDRWSHNGPIPDGLTPVKGSVHIVVNREFVDFIVNNPIAKRLIEWVKPQPTADETFFATLAHNPKLGIRGTFVGLSDAEQIMDRKPWYNRYKSWLDWPCASKRAHNVCILNVGDLPRMKNTPFFFANKFWLKEANVALTCMEQRLLNNTRDVHLGRRIVNTTEYEMSMVVRNRLEPADMGTIIHPVGDGIMVEYKKAVEGV